MNHLEKAILCLIEKHYKKKYVGEIKVVRLFSGGYKLDLKLHEDKGGISISSDVASDEEFLKFIEKELIARQLIKVHYFTGIKTMLEDEQG